MSTNKVMSFSDFNKNLYEESQKRISEDPKKQEFYEKKNRLNAAYAAIIKKCIDSQMNPYCPSEDKKDANGNIIEFGYVDTRPCRNIATGAGFGIKNETILRFYAASLRAETRDFISTAALDHAREAGLPVKVIEGERPIEIAGEKQLYNLCQLENPENILDFFMQRYEMTHTGKNGTSFKMPVVQLNSDPIRLEENQVSSAEKIIAWCNEIGEPARISSEKGYPIRLEQNAVETLVNGIKDSLSQGSKINDEKMFGHFAINFLKRVEANEIEVADSLYKKNGYERAKDRLVTFFEKTAYSLINYPEKKISPEEALRNEKFKDYIEAAKIIVNKKQEMFAQKKNSATKSLQNTKDDDILKAQKNFAIEQAKKKENPELGM